MQQHSHSNRYEQQYRSVVAMIRLSKQRATKNASRHQQRDIRGSPRVGSIPWHTDWLTVSCNVAKHTIWGSRLNTPRGRTIQKTIERLNYRHLSSGEPTYWPTDRNKIPDLVDFCVTKGISPDYISARSCFELSSDHTPILITLSVENSLRSPLPSLCNNNTNWEAFRLLITEHLQLNVHLKTTNDIEAAIHSFNNLNQRVGWDSTPEPPKIPPSPNCPLLIKQNILIKRRLRRIWLRYHSANIKRQLNSATRELKQLLSDNHNACFQQYIQNLSPTASTDYSL
jgi:hypothetical protein